MGQYSIFCSPRPPICCTVPKKQSLSTSAPNGLEVPKDCFSFLFGTVRHVCWFVLQKVFWGQYSVFAVPRLHNAVLSKAKSMILWNRTKPAARISKPAPRNTREKKKYKYIYIYIYIMYTYMSCFAMFVLFVFGERSKKSSTGCLGRIALPAQCQGDGVRKKKQKKMMRVRVCQRLLTDSTWDSRTFRGGSLRGGDQACRERESESKLE